MKILGTALLILLAASASADEQKRLYKFVTADGGESILEGTSIRAGAGFCVELLVGKRVDTIVCGPKYVTEVSVKVLAPAPTPVPTPTPQDKKS